MMMLAASIFSPFNSFAYETPVHRRMSESALTQAQKDTAFLTRLGVSETTLIGGSTIRDIVAQASVDEDRFLPTWSETGLRSLNHFFDPTRLRGLSEPGLDGICRPLGERADIWATDLSGFGVNYAMNHYYDAITGPNPGSRESSMRELFVAQGHMIHLVQDMAQPDHTRNDQHLPLKVAAFGDTAAGLYEQWSLNNLIIQPITGADAFFSGYPTVNLPTYQSYFHEAMLGRGLADYSNANFVTQDTNHSDKPYCGDFDLPKTPSTFRLEAVDERVLVDGQWTTMEVFQSVFSSVVSDTYAKKTETDPNHSYYSLLDFESRKYDQIRAVYSLGDSSFLSRATMLVPRAVGYSAGYMAHFFRGRFDATWGATGTGVFNLKITNTSTEKLGADAKITAIYLLPKALQTNENDAVYQLNQKPLKELIAGFAGLSPGESVTVPGISFNGLDDKGSLAKIERRIAIRGTLGDEPNVVSGLVQGPAVLSGRTVRITYLWDGTAAPDIRVGVGHPCCYVAFGGVNYSNVGSSPYATVTPAKNPGDPIVVELKGVNIGAGITLGPNYLLNGSACVVGDIHAYVEVDGAAFDQRHGSVGSCYSMGLGTVLIK